MQLKVSKNEINMPKIMNDFISALCLSPLVENMPHFCLINFKMLVPLIGNVALYNIIGEVTMRKVEIRLGNSPIVELSKKCFAVCDKC